MGSDDSSDGSSDGYHLGDAWPWNMHCDRGVVQCNGCVHMHRTDACLKIVRLSNIIYPCEPRHTFSYLHGHCLLHQSRQHHNPPEKDPATFAASVDASVLDLSVRVDEFFHELGLLDS